MQAEGWIWLLLDAGALLARCSLVRCSPRSSPITSRHRRLPTRRSSAAAVERIDSGHAVVDTYLKDVKEARLAANREADAELTMSRHQAAAQAALRVAEARTETGRATRVAAAIPLPQPSPLAVHPQQQVAQEVAPEPAKRPVLSRVVSTVTRIPGWVSSNVVGAAAWVVDLPGHVVRLPERRFL